MAKLLGLPKPEENHPVAEKINIDHCNVSGYNYGYMIKSFRHKGLERFFLTGKTSGIRGDHAKRLRLILGRLASSRNPQDMALPGLRLHPLKGDWKGFFAVNVSGNWRIVFRFDAYDAVDVEYLDYH